MAVRIAPGDTRAWSYLGYAYAKKGEVVAAAAAFRRAGQDALANELDQAAKVQRPPTPSRGGSGARSRWRRRCRRCRPPWPPSGARRAGRSPAPATPTTQPPSAREAHARCGPANGPSDDCVDGARLRRAESFAGIGRPASAARGRGGAAAVVRAGAPRAGAVAVDSGGRVPAGDRRRGPRARRRDPGRVRHAQVGAGRPAGAGAGEQRADGARGRGAVLPAHRRRRDLDRRRRQPLAAAAPGRRRPLRPRGSRAGVRRVADLGSGRRPEHGAAHAAVPRAAGRWRSSFRATPSPSR